MTVLRKYQKLESGGLWRDLPEAQRREVVVNLGDASLVLSDPKSDTALTHWSLPAVIRTNPGQRPAIYVPGNDAAESLEIEDDEMIAALDTVAASIALGRARPGRLRGAVLVGLLSAVLGILVLWLPTALVRHTASVLPSATRTQIGGKVLADLAQVTGAACHDPAGVQSLARLSLRIFGPDDTPVLVVVRDGLDRAIHLPGNQIVLSEALIAVPDGPEVAAGFAIAEMQRSKLSDPILPLLRHAGVSATFRLLTTGDISAEAIKGYAEKLLRQPETPLSEDALLAGFVAAGVSSGPYAYAIDATGESVLGLIEADPFPKGPPRPILTDEDWLRLQDICSE